MSKVKHYYYRLEGSDDAYREHNLPQGSLAVSAGSDLVVARGEDGTVKIVKCRQFGVPD